MPHHSANHDCSLVQEFNRALAAKGPARRPEVFLGGTCGESRWRPDQAIPLLKV